MDMPDYRNMYLTMMRAAEDAIGVLSDLPFPESEISLRSELIDILAHGQREAENIYIDTCDEEE